MKLKEIVDRILNDPDSLKMYYDLEEIHSSLTLRYNVHTYLLNLTNFLLKIIATIILIFFFVRAHYIDKVNYSRLDKHQLITYYFKHNLSTSINGYNLQDKKIATLLDAYEYNKAVDYLEHLYNQNKDKTGFLLYLGYSNMCAGNYKTAEIQLKNIAQTESIFRERAMYYLAGCYIFNNNILKAKKTLNNIIVKDGPYASKAKVLLYYLKSTYK